MNIIKKALLEYTTLGLPKIPDMVEELLIVLEKYNKNPIKQTELNEFYKLARNELLSDINGTEDEWEFNTFGNKQFWVNKRRPSIIKTHNAIVDLNGVTFITPDGRIVTSKVSERVIKSFPYKPYTKLLEIPEDTIVTQLYYCMMEFDEDYEYYKQEIDITNIINLCLTGK